MKKQIFVVITSFLLVFGLFGQVSAGDSEGEWTELSVEEFKDLVLGNTMKGRSSNASSRYVEYWEEEGRKIVGLWKGGEYSSRWRKGDENCIMYLGQNGYQCWKLIRHQENGELKWKRGYGHEDTYDVRILEGKHLSTDALYADQ